MFSESPVVVPLCGFDDTNLMQRRTIHVAHAVSPHSHRRTCSTQDGHGVIWSRCQPSAAGRRFEVKKSW